MKVNLNLDKEKKYLVGASGGSDSMTLLSLCVEAGYQLVVAHVNYKLRVNADREEELLKQYCRQHEVPVYTCYPKMEKKENFQNWAREVRYQFYREIYQQEGCAALLLGHQLDDSIETYLMGLKRRSHGWQYGIAEETVHHGMKIIRPLLQVRKKETRAYCLEHQVPFGDDESNFSDKYTRNRIRHEQVETASDEQIALWQNEINAKNRQLAAQLEDIRARYFPGNIDLEMYRNERKATRLTILRYLISQHTETNLSGQHIDELDRQLMKAKRSFHSTVEGSLVLYCEYGVFYLCDRAMAYAYTFDHPQKCKTEWFELTDAGKTIEGITTSEDDWPITVRSPQPQDEIELRIGHKKLNRFFIDRKILHRQRLVWPVVTNRKNRVIFVPEIGCDIAHYSIKPNLFVLK